MTQKANQWSDVIRFQSFHLKSWNKIAFCWNESTLDRWVEKK
jgi:hypothetical protein